MVTGVVTRSADWERVTQTSESSLASLSREVERASLVRCATG